MANTKKNNTTKKSPPTYVKQSKPGKGLQGVIDKAKALWEKHVGWKGSALIRTICSLLMFYWYGETAVLGALIAFFKPDIIDNVQPHFEKGIQKAQEVPPQAWGGVLALVSILYLFDSEESEYFESVMMIVNLVCYILAAQVGADLASRNIARAQAARVKSAVTNVTKKLG